MDVRFYPAAAGSSLPGDPSNLDFAQCLGYYSYNKVIISVLLQVAVILLILYVLDFGACWGAFQEEGILRTDPAG